ncbi:creatininase family protein [Planctellipticum variicoloris]|uniref:creatininase family protein n=1 Tax=Planctellipticum variicoloris TaxID=3064265 RepID=UPI003013EF87|nr:creatininase family protein [Planctomycetaceae bacterium SH412]
MVQLSDLTWPAVEALPRSTPVVIPVAALEQHGGHLPVFTDSLLLGEVVRRASAALEGQALFAPLMWLGNSHHHMDFPGTLSASPRVYLDLLVDLMENFLFHGFRRIILLNGHGGNITPGKQAVFEVRQKYRHREDLLLLFATYWEFADPREGRSDLVQTSMGHACEWETSMILRLAPHLVGPIDGLEPASFEYGFEPAYRGWTTKDRTKLGYIGDPRRATAEKGEHLFEVFTQGIVRHVRDVAGWDGHTWFPPEKA